MNPESQSAPVSVLQYSLAGFDDRALFYSSHPVVTTAFEFPTPPLVRAVNIMLHIIGSGAPGCSFVAHPRFGKSSAITYCCSRLPEAFPDRPVFAFNGHHEPRVTSRSFFNDLLTQTGFQHLKHPRKNPRELLVHAWWMKAQALGSNSIILLGDEMQGPGLDEYIWLVDLTNDLKRLGVKTTAIFFGQPQLLGRRSLFESMQRGDILGRFMTRWFSFEGIASALELEKVFKCYDTAEHGEYPKGSGRCYTEFFFPQAYESGFRLSTGAGICWQLFEAQADAHLKKSRTKKLQIGMQWVTLAAQHVFTQLMDQDRSNFSVAKDQWQQAVIRSGFPASLGLTYLKTRRPS